MPRQAAPAYILPRNVVVKGVPRSSTERWYWTVSVEGVLQPHAACKCNALPLPAPTDRSGVLPFGGGGGIPYCALCLQAGVEALVPQRCGGEPGGKRRRPNDSAHQSTPPPSKKGSRKADTSGKASGKGSGKGGVGQVSTEVVPVGTACHVVCVGRYEANSKNGRGPQGE